MIKKNRDRLFRANKGRLMIKEYMEFLNSLLKINLEVSSFLNLNQTDVINQKYFEQFKTAERKIENKIEIGDTALLDKEINNVSIFHKDKMGYLLGHKSEYCGTVLLPYELLIMNYRKLILYDEDSLNVFSENMSSGLMIDYFDDLDSNQFRKEFYEIVTW
jgi:hypothetical protein